MADGVRAYEKKKVKDNPVRQSNKYYFKFFSLEARSPCVLQTEVPLWFADVPYAVETVENIMSCYTQWKRWSTSHNLEPNFPFRAHTYTQKNTARKANRAAV